MRRPMPALLAPYPGPRPAQIEQIWVIVPFHRVEDFDRVIGNFARQRFPGKRLVLIENGPAIGYCLPRLSKDFAVVLTSDEHQAHAKNVAVRFIRASGGGFFSTMDADDWYGPGYLDEVAGYAKDYDALGKQWHFVSLGEGIRPPAPQLLLTHRRYADMPASWVTGGSISGWTESAVDFPLCTSDDLLWAKAMGESGARIRGLSIYHYLYRRNYARAAHTWTITRDAFIKSVTGYDTLEFPLTASGDIDIDIVTGEKAPIEYRVLGQKRFIPAWP